MKTAILCVLGTILFFVAPVSAQQPVLLTTLYATNQSTTVPTNMIAGLPTATTNIYARRVTLLGKASPRSTNTTVVYVGGLAGNDTQAYPVLPGGEVVLRIPDNNRMNLRDLWFDVTTTGDGLTILYLP